MVKTYKILSALLSYPDEEIRALLPDVTHTLRNEGLLHDQEIEGVSRFVSFFSEQDLMSWQEHYVQLFDHSRYISLYLFEHIHGDSRDRGQAMVDLIRYYAENGLTISSSELPDYLPLILEFLSVQPLENAAEFLAETVNILGCINIRLRSRDNPYMHILAAVIALSSKQPDRDILEKYMHEYPDTDIDKAYHEPSVAFNQKRCENCKS